MKSSFLVHTASQLTVDIWSNSYKNPRHLNASALNIMVVFYVTSATVLFYSNFLQQESVKWENFIAQLTCQ